MPDWLADIGAETWGVVLASAPYILFGLLAAGLLYVYLPPDFIRKALGGSGLGAVLRAALVGAPLPLCSCGVIPTALYLRKEGAGRGAVQSFLISTPETNVDSVALSYALMGPIMAVARPAAALVTAVAAGLGEKLFGAPDPHAESNGTCGCKLCDAPASGPGSGRGGLPGAAHYAFVALMRDLAPWLVLGLALAGIIGALVPPGFFRDHELASGVLPMLLMALVATPMYMCTTASTPVAAALIVKGVSPGAALVFLLVGPATNVATMAAVWRFLGRRSLLIYLVTIVGVSLLLGLGLDAVAGQRVAVDVARIGAEHHRASLWAQVLTWTSAAFFLLLLANGLRLRLVPYWLAWRRKMGFVPAGEPGAAPAADSCCTPGGSEGEARPAACGSEDCSEGLPEESPEAGGSPSNDESSCPHCHSG